VYVHRRYIFVDRTGSEPVKEYFDGRSVNSLIARLATRFARLVIRYGDKRRARRLLSFLKEYDLLSRLPEELVRELERLAQYRVSTRREAETQKY